MPKFRISVESFEEELTEKGYINETAKKKIYEQEVDTLNLTGIISLINNDGSKRKE